MKNKDAAYKYGQEIGRRLREKYPPKILLRYFLIILDAGVLLVITGLVFGWFR